MTGSALFDFLIGIILLFATGFIFFLVIDRVTPDATLNKIAKVAVGVILLVVFLIACKAVLFGGGGAMKIDPHGFLYFCIGVIVILAALIIIEWALNWIAGAMGFGGGTEPGPGGMPGGLVGIVRFVIFAVALIAMLVLADRTLLGGSYTNAFGSFDTQRLSR